MPHFVPVYDPERPRAEQDAADPALRVHRRWETPHALLPAAAGENKDDRAMKLKPVRSHMIRNEKGLWVPVSRVEAEAARRKQQQERARRKWGGVPWPEGDREERCEQLHSLKEARARGGDTQQGGAREAGEYQNGKSEHTSTGSALATPGGADEYRRSYVVTECREKVKSRSSSVESPPVGGRGSDSLLGSKKAEDKSTPLYYERRTNRHNVASEGDELHTKGLSSYYKTESRDESRGAGTSRDVCGSKYASESERVAGGRRSRSNSPSSARCRVTQSRGYGKSCRLLQEERRHCESEVTLTNVTAPSGKIDMFDYMTKKQKALLKQQLSQSALPTRR